MTTELKDFLQIANIRSVSGAADAATLVFVSDQTGVAQLYRAALDGSSEPVMLTEFVEPVQFGACSPKGTKVAFGLARGGDERMQIFLYDLATKEVLQLTKQTDVIHHWGGWSPDGEWITYASNTRNGVDFDVYVMRISTGEERCVFTQGGWCDSVGFSATGRYVFVRVQETFHRHQAYAVDLQQRDAAVYLTPHQGTGEYSSPSWAHDDSAVVFTSSTDREYEAVVSFDFATGTTKTLFAPEWDVLNVAVHPTEPIVACVVSVDGYPRVELHDMRTGATVEENSLPRQLIREIEWSHDGAYLLCIVEDTTLPSNILVWSLREHRHWFVTHNAAHIPQDAYVEPRLERCKSFDGLPIPFFLFESRNPLPTRPAIVLMHGGPESQFCAGFHPLVQYFVSRGYTVVAPNVRGSTGYGKTFMGLDDREKRMDSVRDMESVHKWLVESGTADAEHIALMGGSYGGYMTLAGLAFQPTLWAAGVDTVGMSNLVTFLERTADWRRKIREEEYGFLATDRALLESLSPMNSIDAVRAPLVVIHGANDPRVPLAEAEQIVRALQERKQQAKLLVYEDEGHGLHKLHNRIDAYTQVKDFFDTHLGVK